MPVFSGKNFKVEGMANAGDGAVGPRRSIGAQYLQSPATIDRDGGIGQMPRGGKSAYTDKQKRKAEHIEESYEERGVSKKEAEARAWATVNKESGGGKKSGSGRGKKENRSASRRGGNKAGTKAGKKASKRGGKK